ncbi:MAG: diguanylate cyclase [Ferruginibacter sp.]|uniref:GGDEF domain-containing protein n=1 Tax=Ferruginibacter sp. TaxID=1940288 RepID=UPI00265A20D0|nr:GGDEF domain-containing protein [Ferruginibacter sp.]MDB5277953.1 diguanylate cyclase [Ferruginibacter sp.]
MNYLLKSIRKLKEDALSKLMYDFLKWLLIIIVLFSASIFVPKETTIDTFLSAILHISTYKAILIIISVVFITTAVISTFYKIRLKKIQGDFQTDELTGLKNHKALTPYLTEKISATKRGNQILSIVLIDVDDFAALNEKVGYNTADEILGKAGRLLGNDKRATDETFRYFQRGDEFLIVLNETSMENAMKAAERKRSLIEKTAFEINGEVYNITVCCGVAECKIETDNYETITDRAHDALKSAKKVKGKNSVKNIV